MVFRVTCLRKATALLSSENEILGALFWLGSKSVFKQHYLSLRISDASCIVRSYLEHSPRPLMCKKVL